MSAHRRTPSPSSITLGSWAVGLRDAARDGLLLLALMALAGFAIVVMGWNAAAYTAFVYFQMPVVMSAGFGGLALVGFALLGWSIQDARRHEQSEALLFDEAIVALCSIAESQRR